MATRGKTRLATGGAAAALLLGMIALLALAAPGASARLAGPAGFAGAAASPFANTPPKVTKQPANVTVEAGQPASFESTASGNPAPTVQWELSTDGGGTFAPIEGATSNLYTIAATTTSESGHQLHARFKNLAGETVSKTVTLTVLKAPSVTLQPTSKTVEEGHPVSFEATASGSPAPTVQWQSEPPGKTTYKNIAGANSTVLTIASPKTSEDQTKFRAIFKNSSGEAISEAATMSVIVAPKVTRSPGDTTANEGGEARFEATASGFPAPSIQWERSTDGGETWTEIPEASSNPLILKEVHASDSGNRYRARFSNPAGTVTSESATLTVRTRPVVTLQPQDALVLVGESVKFEAAGTGVPEPGVQWQLSTDGGATWNPIPGATSDTFTITEAQLAQNGNLYRAAFTNVIAQTPSEAARLTVSATKFGAFGWGMNNHGEVGSGSVEPAVSSPAPVKGLQFVTAVAAGMHHSLALLANGHIEAWGFNGHGQLGQEGANTSRVPIEVESIKTATAVAAGGNHSLALLENGTVAAWGDDESGQLGDGKHLDSEIPVAVPGLSNVAAIAAGEEHSLALLKDGTVMAWGANERGQLGTGNKSSSATPVAVKGLSNVAAIAAAGDYSLALLKDGTVVAWGDDEHGQLGSKQLRIEEEAEEKRVEEGGLYSTQPVAVEVLTGVQQIAAGRTHGLALLGGGAVMAWGQGGEGELGNGAMEARVDTPVGVSGLSGATQVSAGDQESEALLTSGAVDAWGNNASGQLGQGTTGSDSDVPVTVKSITGAGGIAAGGSHMLAFGATLPVITSLSPKSGATGGGTSVTISGADLGGATAVKFGANTAGSFKVNSSTSITATSPAGTGTVDVTVVTPAGSSPSAAADRFTYRPAPTVGKLSAKGGPATGGSSVTIEGTELDGASEVDFGGVAGTNLKIVSNEAITVTAPANASGTVDVRVLAPYGESPVSKRDKFKYTPVISSFSPASTPHAGGATIEVSGVGFALGAATKFKFGSAKAKTVNCTSTTLCLVVAPAQSTAGTVDVTAQANKATSELGPTDKFTYE